MGTVLLFQSDSYIRSFPAQIISTWMDQRAIELTQTAFYPGGGGQPYDTGRIIAGTQTFEVIRVYRYQGTVLHELGGDELPASGVSIHGEINWNRRYQLMRTHTAMHILCGVVFRDYGAQVTGGEMEPLNGRMDFEFETLHKDLIGTIESSINREVNAARKITISTLPRDEAFQIPDLIRTKINLLPEGIQSVRVVEIEGLDVQADGGTHVANTSEVGEMRIVDYKSKGRINKRIYLTLESR